MLPRLLQPLQTTPLTSVGNYEARHGLVTQNMRYIPSSLLARLGVGRLMGFPGSAESRVSLGTYRALPSRPSTWQEAEHMLTLLVPRREALWPFLQQALSSLHHSQGLQGTWPSGCPSFGVLQFQQLFRASCGFIGLAVSASHGDPRSCPLAVYYGEESSSDHPSVPPDPE